MIVAPKLLVLLLTCAFFAYAQGNSFTKVRCNGGSEPVRRFLWAWFCGVWAEWYSTLCIVKPETVIAWHRKGFRLVGDCRAPKSSVIRTLW
jgi:hypothetical protein